MIRYSIEKNWQNIENIISVFNSFKQKRFSNVNLPFSKFNHFGNDDSIYFLEHDGHCFVLLYYAKQNFAFIADGSNSFLTDVEVAKELREILNIRLRTCKFHLQTRVDYCASSAVLIALEFTRAYQMDSVPKILTSPPYWRSVIIKRMHKFKSEALPMPKLHLRKRIYRCQKCDHSFGSNRNKCVNHMSKCNKQK